MIDKIPLPTDNLYKFLAIFGMLLIALCFIPYYMSEELSVEIIKIKGELVKYDIKHKPISKKWEELGAETDELSKELEETGRKLKALEKNIDEFVATKKSRQLTEEEIKKHAEGVKKRRDEIKELHLASIEKRKLLEEKRTILEELSIERDLVLEDIKIQNEILDCKNDNTIQTFRIFRGFMIGGFIFCIMGFICWSLDTQRYQDKIIKYQALKLEAEYNKEFMEEKKKENRRRTPRS